MNKAIKKIELDLGGKIVSLTPQQAKNLKDALDDLFGKEIVKVKEYIRDSYPVPYPMPYPVYPPQPHLPIYPRWEYQPNCYYGTELTACDSNIGAGNHSFGDSTLRLTG